MKKNILLLLFFIAAHAQAQERYNKDTCCIDETNFYAKVFGGANFLQNTTIEDNKASYQTGYIVAGSLGYSGHYGLRVEAEYAFRRNAIQKIQFFGNGSSTHGHFHTSSYMANLLWDMPYPFWDIQPFIGTGIGYDSQHMHSSNSHIIFNQKWSQFAWQAMAGFAFPIFRNTELTLEYKFHQGNHFYNNAVGIGLVYKFGFLK